MKGDIRMITYEQTVMNITLKQKEYERLCNNTSIETICGNNLRFIRIMRRNGFADSLILVKWLLYSDTNKEFKFFNIPQLGPVAYAKMVPMLEKHCNIIFPEYIKQDFYKHNRWCSLQKEYTFDKEEMLNEVSLYNEQNV